MRSRNLVVAGLLPIVFGACADSAPEMDRAEQADLDAKLELALPAGGSDPGVASAIELPPPPPAEKVERVVERAPPRIPTPEPAKITAPEAPPEPVQPVWTVTEMPTTRTTGPSHDHEPAESTGRTPLEAKGGAPTRGEGDDDRAPFGRGILIRGGVHETDDCKIHRPGGVAGTPPLVPPPLINERMPQGGNGIPVGGVREPSDMYGAPGRGTMGPGGIASGGAGVARGGTPTTSRGGMVSRGGTSSRGGMGSRGGMRGGIR